MLDRPAFFLLIVCWLGLSPGHAAGADEPVALRRQRIEEMDLVQKKQLLQRHKQFHAFESEERERLRNLHLAIENDPSRDELRRVMDCYYDWLKTLSSYQYMQLRKLPPQERIERIKTIQQEERAPGHGRGRFRYGRFGPGFDRYRMTAEQIAPPDRKALLDWAAAYAARHEDTFIESLADSARQKLRQELSLIADSRNRMQVLFWQIWLRRQLDDPDKPLPDKDDDWLGLTASLSPQMLETLKELPEEKQHEHIVRNMRDLALEHFFVHRSGSVPSVVSHNELAGFLTDDDLDQGTRSWLLGLPSAEMRRRVWSFYLRSKLPPTGQGFPPKGPGGARRLGPSRYGPPQRGAGNRPDPARSDLGRPDPGPPGPGHPGPSPGDRNGPQGLSPRPAKP